jgi:hypothetical protein
MRARSASRCMPSNGIFNRTYGIDESITALLRLCDSAQPHDLYANAVSTTNAKDWSG